MLCSLFQRCNKHCLRPFGLYTYTYGWRERSQVSNQPSPWETLSRNPGGGQGAGRVGNPRLLGVKVEGRGTGRQRTHSLKARACATGRSWQGWLGGRKHVIPTILLINSCHAKLQQLLSPSAFRCGGVRVLAWITHSWLRFLFATYCLTNVNSEEK